jgi:uncharacterized glyoxalase superfamily protein PhnB
MRTDKLCNPLSIHQSEPFERISRGYKLIGFPRYARDKNKMALNSGAYVMSHETERTAPRPVLTSTAAQLFVADIQASCDFYSQKLGFAVDFVYGDPPYYGQVSRDHALLTLRMVCEPVFTQVREREQLLSASLTVATADEIKQLFLNYQAAGVRFQQSLKKEPWGARTFVVMDPDGNLILFAGPAE